MKPKEEIGYNVEPEEMSPEKNVFQKLDAIISLVNLGYATREKLQAFCDKYGIDLILE